MTFSMSIFILGNTKKIDNKLEKGGKGVNHGENQNKDSLDMQEAKSSRK